MMFTKNEGMEGYSIEKLSENMLLPVEAFSTQVQTVQSCYAGFTKYLNEFMIPYLLATNYFSEVEQKKILSASPLESLNSYMELLDFNLDIASRFLVGSMKAINGYNQKELQDAIAAWINTVLGMDGDDIVKFLSRQAKMADMVANVYPQAIRDIEPEYGFHFEQGTHPKIDETDRFVLYQIMPSDERVQVNNSVKPIIILPPYVLGANILSFLPGEKKSYAHCYANQGIPTYIRILKDINTEPALQTMTGEDDAKDTRRFCETIKARHNKLVTLNGYCQGGFSAVCNLLSGELDGLVDALLTCVAPMDGTRSKGLSHFLKSLPTRFNDLDYGTKTLPNGNKVADGKLMGWVYKLKSIEKEAPIVAFIRDMMMLSPRNGKDVKISKTAAALNYWLDYERNDLPLGITRMSFESYNHPISEDGTLSVKLFNRKLNFKRLKEKGIKWLICYGENDDLVEKETALAPLDFIDAEVTSFPKGHVAIATSWSHPESQFALHTRFGDKQARGPVLFQLELDRELSKSDPEPKSSPKAKEAADQSKVSEKKATSGDTSKTKTTVKKTKKKTAPASRSKTAKSKSTTRSKTEKTKPKPPPKKS